MGESEAELEKRIKEQESKMAESGMYSFLGYTFCVHTWLYLNISIGLPTFCVHTWLYLNISIGFPTSCLGRFVSEQK